MKREQIVGKVANALCAYVTANAGTDLDYQPEEFTGEAAALLDVVLPQVTTVAELEALPMHTVLIGTDGYVYSPRRNEFSCLTLETSANPEIVLDKFGPLTIVWRPEA